MNPLALPKDFAMPLGLRANFFSGAYLQKGDWETPRDRQHIASDFPQLENIGALEMASSLSLG